MGREVRQGQQGQLLSQTAHSTRKRGQENAWRGSKLPLVPPQSSPWLVCTKQAAPAGSRLHGEKRGRLLGLSLVKQHRQRDWRAKFPLICRCWGKGRRGEGEARCFSGRCPQRAAPSQPPLFRSRPAKGESRLGKGLKDSRHLIKCLAEHAWRLAVQMPAAQPGSPPRR